jgi:hypothetical protein
MQQFKHNEKNIWCLSLIHLFTGTRSQPDNFSKLHYKYEMCYSLLVIYLTNTSFRQLDMLRS